MNEKPQNAKRLSAPVLQALALTVALCGTACAQEAPQMNLRANTANCWHAPD